MVLTEHQSLWLNSAKMVRSLRALFFAESNTRQNILCRVSVILYSAKLEHSTKSVFLIVLLIGITRLRSHSSDAWPSCAGHESLWSMHARGADRERSPLFGGWLLALHERRAGCATAYRMTMPVLCAARRSLRQRISLHLSASWLHPHAGGVAPRSVAFGRDACREI